MFSNVYSNRRVLVTGHTGFKGSWLCTWLLQLGAKVAGFSIDIPTSPSNFQVLGLENKIQHFQGDIRDRNAINRVIDSFKPEIIFHLAAQSLVRHSYENPALTFETNAIGTMNVLESMRHRPFILAGVIITSDKCYLNVEWTWGYRENDRLGGEDPYSASKACAEIIAFSYVKSFMKNGLNNIATTRAGNVIGGGDWANNRIVPDSIRAWSEGKSVLLRSPNSTRPWQHVLEPLSGYLWLGANLWNNEASVTGESFNFGPSTEVNQSVEELIKSMANYWPGASWELDKATSNEQKESGLLKLNCDKALNFLKWSAALPFSETVRFTSEWYEYYYKNNENDMFAFTNSQIDEYIVQAAKKELLWTK